MNSPVISIYMLTYFHEKYISQAIESVLAQKTHFTYEIVICDDCSKDGTREIIGKYQDKYPDIIRVIYNEENIGIPKNIYQARCKCRGKYIVGLSGDDYWINDSKLEIQATFLEQHPEYIAVFNGIELRYDDDAYAYDIVPKKNERNREFTIKDYEKGGVLRSHGFMMRNLFLNEADREYFKQAQCISDKIDDAVDVVLIMRRGRVFIIDDVTDAHRVVKVDKANGHNYNSRYSRFEKFKQYIELINSMDNHFNRDGLQVEFENKYIGALKIAELDMLFSGKMNEYHEVFGSIPIRYRKPFFKSIYVKSIPDVIEFCINRLSDKFRTKVLGRK